MRIINHLTPGMKRPAYFAPDRACGSTGSRPLTPRINPEIIKLSGWKHIEQPKTWGELSGHPEQEILLDLKLADPAGYIMDILAEQRRTSVDHANLIMQAATRISADIASEHSPYEQFVTFFETIPDSIKGPGGKALDTVELRARTLSHISLRPHLAKAGILLLGLSDTIRERLAGRISTLCPGVIEEMTEAVSRLGGSAAKE